MPIEHLPVPIIASGGRDEKVIVHRDGKPPQVLEGHDGTVNGISFCPTNADVLASASSDQTVTVWGLKNSSNSKIKILECPSFLYSVSWSCDGKYLAAACHDGKCYIFDARDNYKQLCVLEGHTDRVLSVAFHPHDPARCATASADGSVRVWQLASSGSQQPECLNVLEHRVRVKACCWMPDGKHLVSGGGDHVVRLWNVEDGTEVTTFDHSEWVDSVAASPDGRMIASASWDKTCRIWEARSAGKCLQVLKHPFAVRAVTFVSNGLHVVTGGYNAKTRVWSITVGKVVAEVGGHESWIGCIALPPTNNCQAGATTAAPSTSGQQERRCRNEEE